MIKTSKLMYIFSCELVEVVTGLKVNMSKSEMVPILGKC